MSQLSNLIRNTNNSNDAAGRLFFSSCSSYLIQNDFGTSTHCWLDFLVRKTAVGNLILLKSDLAPAAFPIRSDLKEEIILLKFNDFSSREGLEGVLKKLQGLLSVRAKGEPFLIVWDSLNNLLLTNELSVWYSFLEDLFALAAQEDLVSVLGVYHHDLTVSSKHRNGIQFPSILQDLTQCHFILNAKEPLKGKVTAYTCTCDFTMKRRSGKVVRESIKYGLSAQGSLNLLSGASSSAALKKAKEAEKDESSSSKKSNPADNLTFNLTLTETQKAQRETVVLPYLEARNPDLIMPELAILTNDSSNMISIDYIADKQDDFDSDDPDDDLEI